MSRPLVRAALAAAILALPPVAVAGQADAGEALWHREFPQPDGSPARSCTTCHSADLTQPGRHARTGKRIEPMAPSVRPERLTDPAKVEKWLRRNCRWTLGRECTGTEKADVLSFIRSQ